MHRNSLPFAALFILSLSGCSKFLDKFNRAPEGYTNVRFSDGRQNLVTAMDGGMMIYALRQDAPFRTALKLNNASDSTTFTLPNGQYRFQAVGWDSSGMNGTPKCGADTMPLPAALTGNSGVVTIPITVNTGNCDAAPFTDTTLQTGGLSPAQMVFCASDPSTFSSKAYASLCSTEESTRFIKGGAGTGEVSGFTDSDPPSGRILYISDQYINGRDDLYSVRTDGTGMLRQNNPIGSDRNVYDFTVLPGRGKAAYAADEVTNNQYDLFFTNIGTRGGTLVHSACGGCTGIDSMRLTPDHTKLIYAGDMTTASVAELYMIDLTAATPTPVKISHASPTGAGIDSGYGDWEISSDSQYVTFSGYQLSGTENELFTVRLSDQVIRKVSHSTPIASTVINAFFLNHNGTKVVWMSDQSTAGYLEVYASEIFPASIDVKTVSGTPTYSGASYGRLAISRYADHVAYTLREGSDRDALYYADFSNLASISTAAALPVGSVTAADPEFDYIAFLTDGTNHRLMFAGDPETSLMPELFVKDVAFPGSAAIKVSHSTMSTGINISGNEPDLGILDYNTAYYIADTGAAIGDKQLWKANLGGAANNATAVAQSPAAGESFSTINVAYGKVFLTFDNTTLNLPFVHDPSGVSTNSTALPLGGVVEDLTIVEAPRHGQSFPGFPSGIFYRGLATGSSGQSNSVDDLFMLANYASSSPVRLSNMFGGANGAGGVKFRLLGYKSEGGSGITEEGSGIVSDCILPPGTNGSQTTHSLEVPLGMQSQTSFLATAIEIYPNQENCAGSPQRIIFPHGLANPANSTNPSSLKLTSSAGAVRIYVND